MSASPNRPLRPTHPAPLQIAAVFWFLCALLLGLSYVCTSCVHSPEEAATQLQYNAGYSNAIVAIRDAGRSMPPPVNSILELLGAVALAGLGVWNSYLHRQVAEVKNGKAPPARAAPDQRRT